MCRGLQYAHGGALALSFLPPACPPFFFSAPRLSPRRCRHTTKGARMKGASNGHRFLMGNFPDQHGACPNSRLRFSQGRRVWEHQMDLSLSTRHQMNCWTTTGNGDQRAVGVSFHLVGIITLEGERGVYVCVCTEATLLLLLRIPRPPPAPQGQTYMKHSRQKETDEGEDTRLG